MYITYYLHYKGYNYVHYTPLKERGELRMRKEEIMSMNELAGGD